MVSTRSVKHKFYEGEKVLCYEPDPAKTKVLYNSKVLEISCKTDDSGRRSVLFLIHFQGWNSAWDRFVTEDYVLKDTEENRKLQRELAEKAQLTPGGNLYRRDRKRRSHKLSEKVVNTGGEGKKGVSSDSETSEDDRQVQQSHLPLAISDNLKEILQNDFKRINSQNKVLNLPAIPNAVDILQSFLRDFAKAQMDRLCNKKSTFEVTLGTNITPESVCTSFNLCREVVDSIRLYIDFMLEKLLLYPQERNQYTVALSGKLLREIVIKREAPDHSEFPPIHIKEEVDDDVVIVGRDRRRTLRSHQINLDQQIASPKPPPPPPSHHNSCNGRTSLRSSSGEFSGKQEVTAEDDEEPANKMKRKKRLTNDSLKTRPMTAREEELLQKVLGWSIIPEKVYEQIPKPNSLVYGATHLARMFVKLPELVLTSPHSGPKTDLLVDYLNHFMRYLEAHPEWFEDNQYRDNIYASLTNEFVAPENPV